MVKKPGERLPVQMRSLPKMMTEDDDLLKSLRGGVNLCSVAQKEMWQTELPH